MLLHADWFAGMWHQPLPTEPYPVQISSCEMAKSFVAFAGTCVFMHDSIAYSKMLMRKLIIRAFKGKELNVLLFQKHCSLLVHSLPNIEFCLFMHNQDCLPSRKSFIFNQRCGLESYGWLKPWIYWLRLDATKSTSLRLLSLTYLISSPTPNKSKLMCQKLVTFLTTEMLWINVTAANPSAGALKERCVLAVKASRQTADDTLHYVI